MTSPNHQDSIKIRALAFCDHSISVRLLGMGKIGSSPIPEPFPFDLRRFRQDKSNPLSCVIIEADGSEREASLDECIEANLEPGGVWDAPHIQERLLAHFQGTKSITFEEAKLIIPASHRKR